MNEIVVEGYVQRLIGGFSGWQREYAEVKSGEFRYYMDKGRKLKGIVQLSNTRIEMAVADPLRIIIKVPNEKPIHLKCKDIAEKIDWVNALSVGDEEGDNKKKEEVLDSVEDNKGIREGIADLFRSKMISNSGKLDVFITQAWTLQGLLEGTLSDFTSDLEKLKEPTESLKDNANNIKRYTTELKVTQKHK
jgi:hypothetical protein